MDTVDFLRSVAIFSRLGPVELTALAAKLRRHTFQKSETIFHQDDPGDRLHLLAEGMVKISIFSEDGRENDIALLTPGDCFGEMSLLDGGPRSATAVAIGPSKTLALSREDFLVFLSEHAMVALQIISLLVRRLRAMDEMVGDMVFLDVPTRVAKKLVELTHTYRVNRSGTHQVAVPLGQEELSRLVGSSREAVSRALTTYRKMGLLTTSHRRIVITDLEGLEKAATF